MKEFTSYITYRQFTVKTLIIDYIIQANKKG